MLFHVPAAAQPLLHAARVFLLDRGSTANSDKRVFTVLAPVPPHIDRAAARIAGN